MHLHQARFTVKDKILRIVIWHIFGDWSQSEKFVEIKPP